VTVVISGLVSMFLCWCLLRPGMPIRLMDEPNERSLHTVPTPRTGGIAICVALLLGWLLSLAPQYHEVFPARIVLGAAMVATVSLLDDLYGLPQLPRLLMHGVAAFVMIDGGIVIQGELLPGIVIPAGGAVAAACTFLLVLWLTNLYNFMDGMDGFAAGMAVIGFGGLGLLGLWHGDPFFAGTALTVCAAAAGFLWFNFPPARIFMGDSGSTTLGFLAAGLLIWASRRDVLPVWQGLIIFSPFVVDATVTLLGRVLAREALFRAHRSHYYQRLVRIGWGHRRTVLAEYAVMLACGLSVWLVTDKNQFIQWSIIALLLSGYLVVILAIRHMERRTA
jgi:UDP-N-acetylmuramyl pentapeptide phosphotransferase/UDP-N-acetylglucosamine-1-phosphate transferase